MSDDQASFAELVAKAGAGLAAWRRSVAELDAWRAGTANGGPNGDGAYPMTGADDQVKLIPCPAKIATLMPTGQPVDLILQCYADQAVVRVGSRLSPVRVARPLTITGIRASLVLADQSPAETGGLRMDVKVNGVSMLSAPLLIKPNQLSSRAAGTAQPVISAPAIPDDAEVSVDVVAEGLGARGLRVMLVGNYA
ncbi:hypothetical protein ACQR50_09295 [Sphingomonas sp. Xoc002]